MAYRLPPLNTLRLFEAAGRHLSFKLAARELDITPSAVSHGVQTLEDWLGAPLFVRSVRGVRLTPAGETYLPAVRQALMALVTASERIPRATARPSLAISVAPTFGTRLLLPRLAAFQAMHPELAVTIDTSYRAVEFPRDGVDIAVRMGTGDWPGLDVVPILGEWLVPVCAPALLARLGDAGDLRRMPLIRLTSVTEDWDAWAQFSGIDMPGCGRGIMVDTVGMAMQAAVQGLGIAIGRLPLCTAEIAAGTLVPVLGPPVAGRTGYWLVGAAGAMARPEVAAFRDWLVAEMAALPADLTEPSVPHPLTGGQGLASPAPRLRAQGGIDA